MERYSSPAEQNYLGNPASLKTGLVKIFFTIIFLLLLVCILNYFNIFSFSTVFPKQLGWLPRQTMQPKNIIPTPALFNPCKPFPENYGKVNCQKAVETALADTKGTVENVAVGPLEISPALQKILKISKVQTMWLIDIELEKPYTAPNKNLVKSLRVEIPVDGTRAIYRKLINL